MPLRNIWSLQVGEVIVAEYIKNTLSKDYEVFIPLNNQLKDYDLVLMNQKTKKIVKIQVKESREYNLSAANGWFTVSKEKVDNKSADFYVFLIYTAQKQDHKMKMENRFLVVSAEELLKKSKDKNTRLGRYDYYFKIQEDFAFEDRDHKKNPIDYTSCINNFESLRI